MQNNHKKAFIIAEIGNNHEGCFYQAKKLINAAKKCGVDAVKLQYINPHKFISPSDKKNLEKYERFKLSKKNFLKLVKYSKKKKIKIFSTFFDFNSFHEFKKYFDMYKISSTDNNFYDFIKTIIKEKKRTFISLGLLTNIEIEKLINFLNKVDQNNHKYITLLHCSSSYPLAYNEANLKQILFLKKNYPKYQIGYSDHTMGIEASLCALSLGAEVIEKHFTSNNNFSKFRDHKLSSNPNEMGQLVKQSKIINQLLTTKSFEKTNQFKNKKFFRRSIFVNKDLKSGSKIKINDLDFFRAKKGISVRYLSKVLNKKLKQNIKKGNLLSKTFIK